VGEIVARPKVPGILMLGYDGDDAASVDSLRNAWFHCGDSGYLDREGFLYFSERRKHVIRRRGENISSTELERIITTHPEIEACAAVGVPSPLGEDDVKLIVQLRRGSTLTTQQLYTFCQRNMAAFMLPQYIEVLTQLPRTPVGKTDKDALRRLSGKEWVAERPATPQSKGP
jgi:crotonobetaine/carnitine-CoA ligase